MRVNMKWTGAQERQLMREWPHKTMKELARDMGLEFDQIRHKVQYWQGLGLLGKKYLTKATRAS